MAACAAAVYPSFASAKTLVPACCLRISWERRGMEWHQTSNGSKSSLVCVTGRTPGCPI